MGDYLGDLVAKNIGTADVILPRRQSRFEAAQEKGPFEERSEPLVLERSQEVHAAAPVPPVPSDRENQRRQHTDEPAAEVPRNTDDQISQALGNPTPVIQRSTGQGDSPEVAPTLKLHEPQRESPGSPVRPMPADSAESPPQKRSDNQDKIESKINPKTVETIKFVPVNPARSVGKVADREPAADANTSNVAPREFETQEQIIEKHLPIVIEPRIERVVESRVNQAPILQTPNRIPNDNGRVSEPAEVIEPPAINVSIGRVEVRANVPSLPPLEKIREKPQTLSLEDYLQKRRSGGER